MKKKIFAIALAALLFALSIAGASVAYFTDVESATNVFTAGNVNISLTYGVEGEGRYTFNAGASDTDVDFTNGKVYPGQTFVVEPVIENVGTEDAYVGAIITLTGMNGVIAKTSGEKQIPVAVREFLVGLVTTGYTVKIAEDANNDVITVYVIKTDKLLGTGTTGNTDANTAVIFNNVTIPEKWDNAEMAKFNDFKLDIKAYATQTTGANFGTAESAITTAFSDAWSGYAAATAY